MSIFEVCDHIAGVVQDLISGKEEIEINDERSVDDVVSYLSGFADELRAIGIRIEKQGNTEELLDEIHDKYNELWMFHALYYCENMSKAVKALWEYPN